LIGHREGRAGGDDDATHRPGRGVVEALHRLPGVVEDDVLVLDHGVRRQATLGLAEAHRSAGCLEADVQTLGPGELVGDGGAVGPQEGWSKTVVAPDRANSTRPRRVEARTWSGVILAQTG